MKRIQEHEEDSMVIDTLKIKLKHGLQLALSAIISIKKIFIYTNYDLTEYWKKRANDPDQAAVLWQNQEYNRLYREIQREIIARFLPNNLNSEYHILDIGCGIGVVAKMLTNYNPLIVVDAVDFSEMIQVAKSKNPSARITYIESSAEDYFNHGKKYDLIISSACFSAIRDVNSMKKAIINCIKMLKDDGTILMLDPLHRWSYLARVKFNSNDMEAFLKQNNLELVYKSGALFWPYRVLLANSKYSGATLEKKFKRGEWLLSKFGQHFWADYKILAFKKIQPKD